VKYNYALERTDCVGRSTRRYTTFLGAGMKFKDIYENDDLTKAIFDYSRNYAVSGFVFCVAGFMIKASRDAAAKDPEILLAVGVVLAACALFLFMLNAMNGFHRIKRRFGAGGRVALYFTFLAMILPIAVYGVIGINLK